MRAIAWCPAILASALALGLSISRAGENPAAVAGSNAPPASSPPPANLAPPFLSEKSRQGNLPPPSTAAANPSAREHPATSTGESIQSPNTPAITSALRRPFPYVPPVPPTEAIAGAAVPKGEVVEMKPFQVSGTFERTDRALDEKERKIKQEAFTFKDGGTIMKVGDRLELKFKYSPLHKGWDLINLMW
jgi:hypothetical protein